MLVIDWEIVKRINRSMPDGMKIQEFIEGTLKDMVKEYLYILNYRRQIWVMNLSCGNKSGRKYFYLWRGSTGERHCWRRKVFERIIKIEARRIYGG